ncbi:MAG: hypothetical protein R3300_11810 [Candidatus Promineifilaceae bacterium]|nr:hypothetical protein [Candidatus Promineifilaceae bacterium]
MNEVLKALSDLPGISGHEGPVRQFISKHIADHVDDIWVDVLGNLVAVKEGFSDPGYKVLLDAHMDEVGFVITSVERDGTCKFATVGGLDERMLPGKVVAIGSDAISGVIGLKPIHLTKGRERKRKVKLSSLRIDIGAKNRSDAEKHVQPGDPVVFAGSYYESGPIAWGKAMDNRAGCAALVALLAGEPFPFTILASFSVQEEVGLRGAQVVARSVQPDLALILEATPAYDLPTDRDVSPNVVLGQGACLYVMDGGTISDPRLVQHITNLAHDHKIPYQVRQPGGGRTNAAAIQRSAAPLPAATIAVPVRYTHSPTSMMSLVDYGHLIALTEAILRSPDHNSFSG